MKPIKAVGIVITATLALIATTVAIHTGVKIVHFVHRVNRANRANRAVHAAIVFHVNRATCATMQKIVKLKKQITIKKQKNGNKKNKKVQLFLLWDAYNPF